MKSRLHQNLVEQIRNMGVLSDEELLAVIDDCISSEAKRNRMTLYEKIGYRKDLFHAIRGLDILENLLEDPTVTEIMVNGHTNIFIEQAGEIRQYEKTFVSEEKLNDIIQRIVSAANRVVNETTPVVDARLKDGSRINVVLPPVSLVGPVLTVRKFPRQFSMDELVACKTLSEEGAVSLKKLVSARYNLFISGGTGTGKTTFLNALSGYISKKERIITIEDSAELQLEHPNLVRLESRNQNMEGKNAVTIRDLIRTALRMRPDRIIVGEVRSEEAIDMLQAMNTGHDGSISTGHANSPLDMLSRLETMVLMAVDIPLNAVKAQIASAIDVLVHLERFRDGSRRVVAIWEVIGFYEGKICTQPIFIYDREKDCLIRTEHAFVQKEKFERAGIAPF